MPPEHVAILGALLGVAGAADVAQRRIPNLVVGLVGLAGVLAQALSAGGWGVLRGAAAGALAFAVLFLPWRFGVVGGGDLKLASATAIWIGPARLGTFALLTGAAGLPLAIATRAARLLGQRRLSRASGAGEAVLSADRPETAPVAVAIAFGAIATLSWGTPWPW